jgi:nitroreductase
MSTTIDAEAFGLRAAMRTTASVREFTGDDLPDDVLFEILDDARFAPNGGNRQAWHVIVVRDPATRSKIADLYRQAFTEYVAFQAAGLVPFAASEAYWRNPPGAPATPAIDLEAARAVPLPPGLQEHIDKAPVLLVVTVDLSQVVAADSGLGRLSIAAGASVYPFAHNVLLAARARGFGGHITSLLAREEPALRELLHIPDEHVLATMMPLGKPVKQLTKLKRLPVESFTTRETFDGPPLRAAEVSGRKGPSGRP